MFSLPLFALLKMALECLFDLRLALFPANCFPGADEEEGILLCPYTFKVGLQLKSSSFNMTLLPLSFSWRHESESGRLRRTEMVKKTSPRVLDLTNFRKIQDKDCGTFWPNLALLNVLTCFLTKTTTRIISFLFEKIIHVK